MSSKFSLLAFLCLPLFIQAQLNMSLVDNVQYDVNINDIWAYVAPDGTEYALVGAQNGVSIVSLSDPGNAEEVAFIPGQNSIWRDIKTWGNFAYVVTDQSGSTEGVTVIDLSNLPTSVDFYHWTPDIPALGTLNKCHNIYIDEHGYAYLAGCNLNGGGVLYIDVFTTPGVPIYVDKGPARYAHDVFTRGNKMYSSELNIGRMAIYDVSDKANTIELGLQTTPFEFTHNIWLSEDDEIAFTTDELGNAPVTAYDVSDPTDIQELDQYRPSGTLNQNVVPHNVHTWQNWLIISYYTDGGKIVDATRPHNLVEVGNFDTFFDLGGGTNGVWGAYPYLPSGLVLLTDRGNGLYVLDANYVRACYVEGFVTNVNTNLPLEGVAMSIDLEEEPNVNFSGLDGGYATGVATAGSYEISFSKPGYITLTTSVEVVAGEVTLLNVALEPLPIYEFTGTVTNALDASPIADAIVRLDNGLSVFETTTDDDGIFTLPEVYESAYQVYTGAWGYELIDFNHDHQNNEGLILELTPGYKDDFALDLGWEVTMGPLARKGRWEIGEPVGTIHSGQQSNPDFDLPDDIGVGCYVTGNEGGSSSSNDVDGGQQILTSPPIDLTNWQAVDGTSLTLNYSLWFYNGGGNPNDSLTVRLHNETETVVVEVITESLGEWRPASEIVVEDHIDVDNLLWISFTTSDFDENGGHIVEAAVDVFSLQGAMMVTANEEIFETANWILAPNPFKDQVQVDLSLVEGLNKGTIKVFDTLGRLVDEYSVGSLQNNMFIGENWPKGVYFLQLEVNDRSIKTTRVVKQ